MNDYDKHGKTKLYNAVKARDLLLVRKLLAAGADTNFPILKGIRPLSAASKLGDIEIVKLLVNAGAKVDAQSANGETPLYVAAARGFVDVVEFLIFAGASVDLRDNDHWSSVYVASRHGFASVVTTLAACGADIEAQTLNGLRPLTSAVINDRAECVRILLELGADVNPQFPIPDTTNEIKAMLSQTASISHADRAATRFAAMNRLRTRVGARLMRFAQQDIIGICIAMSSLELPPYVLLWIIDWLPNYDRLPHLRKIRLIESTITSIRLK